MAEKVTHLWAEINEKNRLDLSDQRLSDDDVDKILKGLHMIAKTSGFLTERTRPFPLTEIDFSGNEITRKGVGEVVQFARTQGCKAALVDLSKNRLDDEAALEELSRLVKNYGSFSHNNFLGELLLSGNKIGREGATKLIQYAHWERDRRNSSKPDEPKISMKLDLSDNCIESPAELIEELNKKRIRCSDSADKEEDTTVHLPDFTDQRPPISRQPPARGPNSARPRGGYGGGGGGYGGGGYRGRDDRRGGGGYGGGYARERDPRGGRDYGGPSYDRPPPASATTAADRHLANTSDAADRLLATADRLLATGASASTTGATATMSGAGGVAAMTTSRTTTAAAIGTRCAPNAECVLELFEAALVA